MTTDGTLTVDGTISANGWGAGYSWAGGGSGGSIWLTATELSGAGVLQANGGNCSTAGGAGGAGRIAVWYGGPYGTEVTAKILAGQEVTGVTLDAPAPATFSGTRSVLGGTGGNDGQDGTTAYVFYQRPPEGTLFMMR